MLVVVGRELGELYQQTVACLPSGWSIPLLTGSGDTNDTLDFRHARRVIERLMEQEIGRRYFVVLPYEQRDIRCVNPGAAWNDSSNLVRVTKFVT